MNTCKAIAAVAVTLAALSSIARADATVGAADNAICYPFMCNDSATASGVAIQYQQVYAANEFSGPMLITSETFYDLYAQMFGGNDLLLGGTYVFSLSTTSAAVNHLSTTLPDNIGPDNTEVLTFTVPPGGDTFGTDYTFDNSTSFLYDPANGNLLLDIMVTGQDNTPNGQNNSYNDADDTGDVTSRAYEFLGDPTTAAADSTGLVTTFGTTTALPEPSSFALLLAGMLGVGGLLKQRLSR